MVEEVETAVEQVVPQSEAQESNGRPCLSAFLLPSAVLGIFMKRQMWRSRESR